MFNIWFSVRLSNIAVLVCFFTTAGALAQGSLTPPGSPSASMVSLDQVEPRTPVESLPGSATAIHTISASGSYCLTGNLTGVSGKSGIEITASYVTLDLNGFTLTGVPGSLNGIDSTQDHVTVVNGTVRSWGGTGIDLSSWAHVENIQAAANTYFGISVDNASLIANCQSRQNLSSGLYAVGTTVVRDCVSMNNVGEGIGIASSGGQILNCVFGYNDTYGISAGAGGSWLIQGNTCIYNGSHGIDVCFGNQILDNVCTDNGAGGGVTDGAGINVRCGSNLVRGNLLVDNDVGVSAWINGNEVIIQNIAIGNTGGSYNGSTGNDIGPIGSASTATSPWANIHH